MNQQTTTAPDIPMSTSETICNRILEIPTNEEFVIIIPIGGDPYVDEQD